MHYQELINKTAKILRPWVREIIILFLGFLLGVLTSFYFEHRSDQNRRISLLRAVENEIRINTTASWYPMYFDSVAHNSDGFPYPTLDDDALNNLRRESWLILENLENENERFQFINTLSETIGILEEFNERIHLRNISIIDGKFSTRQNALAFNFYHKEVLPKLTHCLSLFQGNLDTFGQ